jgi:hypothetical protein
MPHRISNQSLLRQLAVVVQLGAVNVSSRLFVEVCRNRGQAIGELFFLHFDTLFDYGFLTSVSPVNERKGTDLTVVSGFSRNAFGICNLV